MFLVNKVKEKNAFRGESLDCKLVLFQGQKDCSKKKSSEN